MGPDEPVGPIGPVSPPKGNEPEDAPVGPIGPVGPGKYIPVGLEQEVEQQGSEGFGDRSYLMM